MKLLLPLLLAYASSGYGAEWWIGVNWEDLCAVTGRRSIVVKTTTGETVEGRCMSVGTDELSIRRNNRTVQISRASVVKIGLRKPWHGERSAAVDRMVSDSLLLGFLTANPPLLPAALVLFSFSAGLELLGRPASLIADLRDRARHLIEVRPI